MFFQNMPDGMSWPTFLFQKHKISAKTLLPVSFVQLTLQEKNVICWDVALTTVAAFMLVRNVNRPGLDAWIIRPERLTTWPKW